MSEALGSYKSKSFSVPESIRAEIARAQAAKAEQAAKEKADNEKKEKEDKAKAVKNAGSKLLDRITGKTTPKPQEGTGKATN